MESEVGEMMDPQALQQIMANAQQVQALQQQFSQFAQQFQGNQSFNPYDRVQGMMRSGEMSPIRLRALSPNGQHDDG